MGTADAADAAADAEGADVDADAAADGATSPVKRPRALAGAPEGTPTKAPAKPKPRASEAAAARAVAAAAAAAEGQRFRLTRGASGTADVEEEVRQYSNGLQDQSTLRKYKALGKQLAPLCRDGKAMARAEEAGKEDKSSSAAASGAPDAGLLGAFQSQRQRARVAVRRE